MLRKNIIFALCSLAMTLALLGIFLEIKTTLFSGICLVTLVVSSIVIGRESSIW